MRDEKGRRNRAMHHGRAVKSGGPVSLRWKRKKKKKRKKRKEKKRAERDGIMEPLRSRRDFPRPGAAKSISRNSIYLYLLFLGGVRAQLTGLRESCRLACFATIIQLSLSLSPCRKSTPSVGPRKPPSERHILESKDIYGLLLIPGESVPGARFISGDGKRAPLPRKSFTRKENEAHASSIR